MHGLKMTSRFLPVQEHTGDVSLFQLSRARAGFSTSENQSQEDLSEKKK